MNSNWLTELNTSQYEAVTSGDGPLLVIAGAGSGKTKTLASRVAYLVSKGVSPDKILLLTFTRRASKEMLSRASHITGDQNVISKVWGGTFHAVANRLLRIYAQALELNPEFTIMDQSDSEDLLDVVRQKTVNIKKGGRFPKKGTLLAIYSRRMNSGDTLEFILKKYFPWCERWKDELKLIYKEYVIQKQRNAILDYDDLLLYWYYLLEDSRVVSLIEKRFEHILVDEYQDTNKMQADILVGMRKNNRNIMVVGDDAQSIYSFRSASVRNILDFPKLFENTRIITLEQNYRSTNLILDTTNTLISQSKERFTKNLFSQRTGSKKPQLITCSDEGHEADTVVERILEHYEQGVALRNQAVLFRAGSHSATLEIALMKKNIPFHKYGGLKFLEAAHVKDFVALIRILENFQDEMAWFRILQLLEGIGPAYAAAVFEHLRVNAFDLSQLDKTPLSKDIQNELHHLQRVLIAVAGNKESNLSSQLEQVKNYYIPLLDDNYENTQPRRNDIDHLVEMASGYTSRTQYLSDLVLDPPSSTSDLAGPPLRDEDYLVLSTIHSAKGCEWDVVYLIHAADGCLPSDMSTDSDEEIAEELRLAYVAMTRAKDHLYVTWPLRFYSRPFGQSDNHSYSQCSRFFSDDVKKTMDLLTEDGKIITEDEKVELAPSRDIKKKIQGFWD
jgi:DNA helicase-2/ATP-dependent DNA helicase PcrA